MSLASAATAVRPAAPQDIPPVPSRAPTAAPAGLSRRAAWVWVALLVTAATGLRLATLTRAPMLNDEGESSLNALTILQRGVPWWTYQGQPIFENIMIQPWPEHEEYEFRDISYSDRGVAIYHGWMPLYAIAASLALYDIGPDPVYDPPRVLHSWAEIERRKWAARLPSVLFSALFCVGVYWLGSTVYGRDAGFVALGVAAFADNCIWFGQQARYYAAMLAVAAFAVLLIWRLARHGRWRDVLATAAVLTVLFHTHATSFVTICASFLLFLPAILRHEQAFRKLMVLGLIIALGIFPFAFWSGMLATLASSKVPTARSMLVFPEDYLLYLRVKPRLAILLFVAIGGLAAFELLRRKLPERVREPLADARGVAWLLLAMIFIGYWTFLLLMPAASCFLPRMSLNYFIPATVLTGVLVAATLRVAAPRQATTLALALAVGLALWSGQRVAHDVTQLEDTALQELTEHFRNTPLAAGTRLYCEPRRQFVLTYLTGMPVQSVAPVRKSFFDRWPGEMVIVDGDSRLRGVPQSLLAKYAAEAGKPLSAAELQQWETRLATRLQRENLAAKVAEVSPPVEPLPAHIQQAVDHQRRRLPHLSVGSYDSYADNPAMFREYPIKTYREFWTTYFYRFVDPKSRSGPNLNYAGRIADARAVVLSSGWTVYHCPARDGLGATGSKKAESGGRKAEGGKRRAEGGGRRA